VDPHAGRLPAITAGSALSLAERASACRRPRVIPERPRRAHFGRACHRQPTRMIVGSACGALTGRPVASQAFRGLDSAQRSLAKNPNAKALWQRTPPSHGPTDLTNSHLSLISDSISESLEAIPKSFKVFWGDGGCFITVVLDGFIILKLPERRVIPFCEFPLEVWTPSLFEIVLC
jgi:hypothetical protein